MNGVVAGQRGNPATRGSDDLTGEAALDFLGRVDGRRIDPGLRRTLLDRLELSSADLRRKIRESSTGMKRKLAGRL